MNGQRLLEKKVCLITGTSRGIGRAVAERYAEEGAIVFANARKPGSIDEWAKDCSLKNQTTVSPVYFDVTDYAAVKQVVSEIAKEQKRIDVLVNNAGVVTHELLSMIQLDSLRNMFEVNVVAMIQLMQLVSRIMSRQKAGSIINISSMVGVRGVRGQLAYSATKGAVVALTKSAAKELSSQNIRVNSIAPGMVETEMIRSVSDKTFSERLANIGFGRLGKPIDIANACVFLGSDLSEYISGQVLGVDGCTIM
jgi:3-oxoacyl-[acyl-carrier protein] reductase